MEIIKEVELLAKNAKRASRSLALMSEKQKNDLLVKLSELLVENSQKIIDANALDLASAEENGVAKAMLDRLMVNKARIEAIAASPSFGGMRSPKGELLLALQRDYGSLEGFFSAVKKEALKGGIGFLWALKGRRGITLRFLENHAVPLGPEEPLFCMDLWEHAYFLRYRERRDAYVYGFFRIINWVEIEKRYQKSKR